MKNIIIAAGYATRLYPLTENYPKSLLQIGSNTILGRIVDDVDKIDDIDEHIIVTNHKFARFFERWKTSSNYNKPITIIDDGTLTNETRLGAVKDLLLAIYTRDINDDIMVLAADNILDFSFNGFVEFFKERRTSIIMCYRESRLERLQRTGVVDVDSNMKVLAMQEKPKDPISNWAVPPFYIYKKEDIPFIKDSINNGCGFDAPGNLAHYLVHVTVIHAWEMPGHRFDIGSIDSYKEAQIIYK